MLRKLTFIIFLLISVLSPLAQADSILGKLLEQDEETFLSPDQAFQLTLSVDSDRQLLAKFTIAPGHYLYKSRLQLKTDNATLANITLPDGEMKNDPNFGTQEVYHHDFVVKAMVTPQTETQTQITVHAKYQGCSEKGLCYAPIRKSVDLSLTGLASQSGTTASASAQNVSTTYAPEDTTALLASGNLAWILAGFFGAGLLLSFTPCVLPMIPILSSIIVGSQQQDGTSAKSPMLLSLAYVLGMALSYTLAGVAAGLSGSLISQSLQNPWVLSAAAFVFVLLSLSMFGFYELKLPSSVESRMLATSQRLKGGEYIGVFIMGALSALIVSPCVAAPLAGALLYIGQTHNVLLGGLGLFSLAIGMGVPLLLIGASAGKLLPKAGAWMNIVKHLFGLMMLAMAVWIVSPFIGATWLLLLSALLVSATAAYGIEVSKTVDGVGGKVVARAMGFMGFVYAAALLLGALSGGQSLLKPLSSLSLGHTTATQAKGLAFQRIDSIDALRQQLEAVSGQPVMLDFYADWCVACKEMEHDTFTDANVQQLLANTVLLQADVTDNNAADQALLKRFGLYGPPGILFFDRQGQLINTTKVVGFKDPEAFSAVIARRDACLNNSTQC